MITLVELFEGSSSFVCLFVCSLVFRPQFIVLSQTWTTRTSRKAIE